MKTVRILAFALALVLALSGMGVSVRAEGDAAPSQSPPAESAETENAGGGDSDPSAEDTFKEESGETEESEESEAPGEENPAEPKIAEDGNQEFIPVKGTESTLSTVSITWDESPVAFTVLDAVTWDAEDLCWVTDTTRNGKLVIAGESNVKTFTVTNSTEDELVASVSFTPDSALPAVFKAANPGITVAETTAVPAATVEEEQNVPGSAAITVTLNLNLDTVRLTDAAVTTGTFGSFTVSITKKPDENPQP